MYMTLLVTLQLSSHTPPAGPKARLVVYTALPVDSRAKSYPPRFVRKSKNWLSALCPGGGGVYVPSPDRGSAKEDQEGVPTGQATVWL